MPFLSLLQEEEEESLMVCVGHSGGKYKGVEGETQQGRKGDCTGLGAMNSRVSRSCVTSLSSDNQGSAVLWINTAALLFYPLWL